MNFIRNSLSRSPTPDVQEIEKILTELLLDFDVLAKASRDYKLILDDVTYTTNAQYVTQSASGFFTDKIQPAYLCLRCCVYLIKGVHATGAERAQFVEKAREDFKKAQWDGVSMFL